MKNSLNTKDILSNLSSYFRALTKHAAFLGILIVLLTYILVVWQISQMATAEPSADASASVQTSIPRIDQKAIKQIQSLEQNNNQVHSLFDQARNNPFQE